jgi:hypothetical protein
MRDTLRALRAAALGVVACAPRRPTPRSSGACALLACDAPHDLESLIKAALRRCGTSS